MNNLFTSLSLIFLLISGTFYGQEIELEPSFIQKFKVASDKEKPKTKKVNAINIVRLTDTLSLPFIDDFSSNKLAPINTSSADSNYTLIYQYQYYELGESSHFTSINRSLDTSFTIVMTVSDTTITANLPIDSIVRYNYQVYPNQIVDTLPVWNNYSLNDSNNTGNFDTVFTAVLTNDSMSFGIVQPQKNIWLDNSVFINSNYAVNMPSIGVATLDAVDYYGYVYSHGSTANFPGDSLTSKPIKLNTTPASNQIFLSFMAQKGGLGDEPENSDVLIIQFKDSLGSWNEVWNSNTENNITNNNFHSVYIAVNDVSYIHNSFQFRFINYASLSNVSNSWKGNADQWHIDYVVLDSNRTVNDNYINDVSFAEKPSTKINNYYSVPWTHYKQNTSITKSTSTVKVNNTGTQSPLVNFSSSVDENGSSIFQDNNSSSQTISANSSAVFTQNYTGFTFSSAESYIANFNVSHQLNSSLGDLILSNDTSTLNQVFNQNYAHDDGSAEAGYGINSYNGRFALKYDLLTNGDTLTAVDIYINNTLTQENFNVPIKIIVWNDNNGVPGDTLYTSISRFPISSDSLNSFLSYKLERPIMVSGTIYVGWQQLSTELLNIGLDKNTTLTDKAFYNVNSTWEKSGIQGAVMIHPRFGSYQFLAVEHIKRNNAIFPNPCTENVSVKGIQKAQVSIYDLKGQLLQMQSSVNSNDLIPVNNLPNGTYILEIIEENKISTHKLIKQ